MTALHLRIATVKTRTRRLWKGTMLYLLPFIPDPTICVVVVVFLIVGFKFKKKRK